MLPSVCTLCPVSYMQIYWFFARLDVPPKLNKNTTQEVVDKEKKLPFSPVHIQH